MAGRGGAATVYSSGLIVALVLSSVCVSTWAFNITQVLDVYPDFSQLNDWLSRTGVADEINNRSTLTILAPNNEVLGVYLSTVPNAYNNPDLIGDTLRYHVLLTYFGITELQEVPANGTSVTTLLQTTGRANESEGFVTIYNNGTSYLVGHEYTDKFGNETILSNVTQSPYAYSVLQVSAILSPVPPALPSPAPAPSPFSKVPTPAPSAPTVPANGPTASETTSPDSNHAGMVSASGLLVLLALLFASSVALL
jgi:hypothetical protein